MSALGRQPHDMDDDELRDQIAHWQSEVARAQHDSDPGVGEEARRALDAHITEALERGITHKPR